MRGRRWEMSSRISSQPGRRADRCQRWHSRVERRRHPRRNGRGEGRSRGRSGSRLKIAPKPSRAIRAARAPGRRRTTAGEGTRRRPAGLLASENLVSSFCGRAKTLSGCSRPCGRPACAISAEMRLIRSGTQLFPCCAEDALRSARPASGQPAGRNKKKTAFTLLTGGPAWTIRTRAGFIWLFLIFFYFFALHSVKKNQLPVIRVLYLSNVSASLSFVYSPSCLNGQVLGPQLGRRFFWFRFLAHE